MDNSSISSTHSGESVRSERDIQEDGYDDVDALAQRLQTEQAHVFTLRKTLEKAKKRAKTKLKVTEKEKPWEYCIVFPIKEVKGDEKLQKDQLEVKEKERLDLCKETVSKLHHAGLKTLCFWSYEKDEVYVQIRAPLARLKMWADISDRKMLLNALVLKQTAEGGNEERGIKPFVINNEIDEGGRHLSSFSPYEWIYGKYETDEVLQPLYERPDREHPFTDVLKLQLLIGILGARSDKGGAGLQLRQMLFQGKIKGHFPLHNTTTKGDVIDKWARWNYLPWRMPDMKEYFGEMIGMYFQFLSHYTTWLIAPGIFGFVVAVVTWSQHTTESPLVAAFSLFIILWAVFMMEFWKRKQSLLQLHWGMNDIRQGQVDRPEFHGKIVNSPITGEPITYFPKSQYKWLKTQSVCILSLLLITTIVLTAAVFAFRTFMANGYAPRSPAPSWGKPWGSILGSVMMSVQINVMNTLYKSIAVWSTNRENHRTDAEYVDSLVVKLFLFQFVNSYASFYHIAFIQSQLPGGCDGGSCMDTLLSNLAIIFLVQLFIGNASEVLMSYLANKKKLYEELNNLQASAVQASKAELEYTMNVYDDIMGPLLDYNTIVIQFGFLTLFVAAFPLAPLAALANNFASIKMDSFKLIHMLQRPIPVPAQDIGTWQAVFNLLIIMAVSTNAGLICFVMKNVLTCSPAMKVWAFVIIQYGVFSLMYAVQEYVPDVPEDVELQLQRASYLVSKVIERVPDEEDEVVSDDEESESRQLRKGSMVIIDHNNLKAVNKDLFDMVKAEAFNVKDRLFSKKNSGSKVAAEPSSKVAPEPANKK